jgi:glycine cleavage system H protein
LEINENLEDSPELVNESALIDGWIAIIKLFAPSELGNVVNFEIYSKTIED